VIALVLLLLVLLMLLMLLMLLVVCCRIADVEIAVLANHQQLVLVPHLAQTQLSEDH